jgi:hypothetical protein
LRKKGVMNMAVIRDILATKRRWTHVNIGSRRARSESTHSGECL